MVTLPKDFVATRYPGYFWNVIEKKLYTLKGTGLLKQMTFSFGGTFNGCYVEPGYRISVNGIRKKYSMTYLCSLKATDQIQEIGIHN